MLAGPAQIKDVVIHSYEKIYRDAQSQSKTNKFCAVRRFKSGEELRKGVTKVYITGGPMKMLYAQQMVRDLHNAALTDDDFKFDHPMDAVVKGGYNYGLEMESVSPVSTSSCALLVLSNLHVRVYCLIITKSNDQVL